MKTIFLTVSSFASTYLSHCLSFLPAFLYSKTCRNNQIHCEIIDRYCNVFFVEIQLKRENLKSVFRAPEFGHPDRYTGLPNGLNTSLLTSSLAFNQLRSIHKAVGLQSEYPSPRCIANLNSRAALARKQVGLMLPTTRHSLFCLWFQLGPTREGRQSGVEEGEAIHFISFHLILT